MVGAAGLGAGLGGATARTAQFNGAMSTGLGSAADEIATGVMEGVGAGLAERGVGALQ